MNHGQLVTTLVIQAQVEWKVDTEDSNACRNSGSGTSWERLYLLIMDVETARGRN